MRPAPEESAMRTPLRRHSVLGIGIGDAEAGENDPLQRFHLLRLVGLLVVVAQQMQDAVDQQVDRVVRHRLDLLQWLRTEEHTSELQYLMRISSAVFCLNKKMTPKKYTTNIQE